MNTSQIRSKLQDAFDQLSEHEATFGENPDDAGQAERRSRLLRQIDNLGAELDAAEAEAVERAAKLDAIKNAKFTESGFGGGHGSVRSSSRDPWVDRVESIGTDRLAGRAEEALSRCEDVVSEAADRLAAAAGESSQTARFVIARSNPHYRSAFEKIVANPHRGLWTLSDHERSALEDVEAIRATLTTNTASGGWLLPLSLDPGVILANSGQANPLRQVARVVTAPVSPHRLISSTGASSGWVAENTAVSDGSPTFDRVDVALHKAAHWVTGSFEVIADGQLLAANVATIAADARAAIESSAFAIGSGSGAPYGVVTRVGAVTASRVAPTTGGTFTTASVADVYRTFDALPARARQSPKLAWLANNSVFSIIRQMSPSANGSSFWSDLSGATPPSLLGAPRYEVSAMDSAMTTGAEVLVVGDFDRYTIVDHASGPSLEYIENVVNSDGVPVGARGWLFHHRVGADVTDSGAFRVLQL